MTSFDHLDIVTKPSPEIYMTDNWVALDFETTNNRKGDARYENSVVCACWTNGPGHKRAGGVRRKYGHEYHQQELVQDVKDADFIIAHNVAFELSWLEKCGVPLHTVLPYDTMLGDYMRAGNRRWKLDMDSVAARYGAGGKSGLTSAIIRGGVCPSEIPKKWLLDYCEQDVRLLVKTFLRQREILRQDGLLGVQYTACTFTPVLVDIANQGMFLDSDRVLNMYKEVLREQNDIEAALMEFSDGVNFGSPQQVAHFIYGDMGMKELTDARGRPIRNKPTKQFPDGAPKTDKDTLLALKPENEKQEELIELLRRKSVADQKMSMYLKKFREVVLDGGILYGSFNQAVTGTHRLSSSGPNFQNFDRTFKPMFTARSPDTVIGERDASQLEFRVAAQLGNDEVAMRDILNKEDVHAFTAEVIYGVTEGDAGFKEARTAAKSHTFKPLYGGTSGTEREQAYYRAFKEKYRGLAETQDQWVDLALQQGWTKNVTGLVWYWGDVRVTRSGYVEGNTRVRNYPIQYLATGEIVPIAVTYVWHHMKKEGMKSFIINTVHDSIITEEYPEETDRLTELTEEGFSSHVPAYLEQVYGYSWRVPLEIETETGPYWGE